MSSIEEVPETTTTKTTTTTTSSAETTKETDENEKIDDVEAQRGEKILLAKELYSQGSRNFLVKSYREAVDQLSQVCGLYEEIYGEMSAELGMPYLLYAKSLMGLAFSENKLLDVPEEADDDDEDEDEDVEEENEEGEEANEKNGIEANGKKPTNEADSTADDDDKNKKETKKPEDAQVTSSSSSNNNTALKNGNGEVAASSSSSKTVAGPVLDDEKPSTSNGDAETVEGDEDDENEAAEHLQLAWELLESAAIIFSRQGLSGLPNMAEAQTELANIEFENNFMESARNDYRKALSTYEELPKNYNRAMAEIHYKIGLTYLMEQFNKEGADSLKKACDLMEAEIADIKSKDELTEKDKNNIQDMEETKQEIRAKIDEIEETEAQNIAEVRAALDSYIKPLVSQNAEGASTSSSAAAAAAKKSNGDGPASSSSSTLTSKPTDISHLIKRKKPDDAVATEVNASPAKRPAV